MEIFVGFLALIWSIICIILFFKIWGMTNNVEKLTREVHELRMIIERGHTPTKIVPKQKNNKSLQSHTNTTIEDYKIGDIITLKSNGERYIVTGFKDDGKIQCEPL